MAYEYIGEGIKPPQVETMAQATGKALTLAGLVQENQTRALQLREAQQDFQDQQIGRQAYMDSGGDLDKYQQNLMQRGVSPKMVIATQKSIADAKEARLKMTKGEQEVQDNKNKVYGSTAASLLQLPPEQRQAYWQQNGMPTLVQAGFKPSELQPNLPTDPNEQNQFLQFHANQANTVTQIADEVRKAEAEKRAAALAVPTLEKAKAEALTAGLAGAAQTVDQVSNQDQYTAWRSGLPAEVQKQIPAFYSPAAVAIIKRQAVPVKEQPEFDIKQEQLRTGAAGNTEFDQFMVKYGQSLGKTPGQLTSGEFNAGMQKFKQFSQDPALRDLAIAQKQTALAQQAANAGPPKPIEPGSAQYKVAQDLAYGRLPFSQFRTLYAYSRDSNAKLGIYQLAGELNPNFNPGAFEMGFKFASNPKTQAQLASLDNIVRGVPDLLAISDKASRTGVPLINKYIIPGGIALGGKKYSDFNTAQTAFADELSGALGYGSATDMSREMGFNMTDKSLSPEAFRSAIQTVIMPFIDRKRASMLNQMGVYGQPGMNPAAAPAVATGGGNAITVRDPRGTVHTFPTQKAADDFKKAAGIQ